jgi:hypothetical protein
MTSDRVARLFAVIACVLMWTPPASAQSVSDVLLFLLTNESVPTGSQARDRAAAQATADTISRALLASLATLPVPTSSGGFVYRLNPELGTVERRTPGFGPSFVERAQPAGRGQASFGIAFQQLQFDSLDGRNLRDGSFVTTANQFPDEAAPFDVDRLTLAVDASIATLYGGVGVTDRLEVGFAAPLVLLQVEGTRNNIYRSRAFTQATASARAIGLADFVARAKYAVYDTAHAAIAAAVDVRLPTGRTEDLLGAGSPSMLLSGIGSFGGGPVTAHVDAGVSMGGLARELRYGGALEVAAAPRVTVIGEVLGRWVDTAGHIVSESTANQTLPGVLTVRLVPDTSTLRTLTAAPGVKWNVSDTWVLAASATVPLTSSGLTASVTPFVGLDYAWSR